ncbi:MAG: RNA polymerase sigma factor [Acidobacteria bacterium]|nr:RNA polymerase sigma factor [Acidobacteriota bacterium]
MTTLAPSMSAIPRPPFLASIGAPDDSESLASERLAAKRYEEVLEVLMEAYGNALFRYCQQQLRDRDLAADVHQTVFVQAFDALHSFGGRSSFRTWLFGIARHRCLDAAKIRRRRERRFQLTDRLPEAPSEGLGPEERLSGHRRRRALADCLASLAPRIRDAVLLRFQQGLSYVEMSTLAGERAPTLQARVVRALPNLRRCLEEKGVTP